VQVDEPRCSQRRSDLGVQYMLDCGCDHLQIERF
jgi:hypothetical protein